MDELPRGVTFVRTLGEHPRTINALAFHPKGEIVASGGYDGEVRLWDLQTGDRLRTLKGHDYMVNSVAFNSEGTTLVTASSDETFRLWDVSSGKLLKTFKRNESFRCVTFDKNSGAVVTASGEAVKFWDPDTGEMLDSFSSGYGSAWSIAFDPLNNLLAIGWAYATVQIWSKNQETLTFKGHTADVLSLAFAPHGGILATGSADKTVKVWDMSTSKLLRNLEGHTKSIDAVTFSGDGRLLASKSRDQTIRIWSTEIWETIATIPVPAEEYWVPALAFHPILPLLATWGSTPNATPQELGRLLNLWRLDADLLLRQRGQPTTVRDAVHHTTGKVVLVGDHSVGKSALGHRLIHHVFEKQESTHGQKFWVFPDLGKILDDGTECEAILWDLAGQPDYRLVHALFVDNADLALALFDASDIHDPLHGIGFWLKQLKAGQSSCPIILVAAQTDRGSSTLTEAELRAFTQRYGIVGPIATSAATGEGISELIEAMKSLMRWDDKPKTVTTATFKWIKDYVLTLKETEAERKTIVTFEELRNLLQASNPDSDFTDDQMVTAVGHLENYGYVRRLRTSKGQLRILLQPERLNNLASSFVLEARRNQKGLGALEEKRLLPGGYEFPELVDLNNADRDVLLDSATLLFLEHNVCFREIDPLRIEPYLVFPELINLKRPLDNDTAVEDGVAYTVSGPTENVFASLVVLLGYTHMFTRTAQWQNNARYEVGEGFVCGFRQEAERDGELDFVLCFAPNVGASVRTLFQGLFESFLSRRNLTVRRFLPIFCSKGHMLNRAVVREALQQGDTTTFCSKCGEQLIVPSLEEPIQLTQEQQVKVESQRRSAEQRTRFEQAVFRLRAFVTDQKITPPTCFISYAWGTADDERWVEKRLATDLQKAGVDVLLDRWHNAQIGASIARFVERIEESDCVVVVGTPQYRQKAKNLVSPKGSVVAAEYELAGLRLLAAEGDKRTVLPVLLQGDEAESFPALLRGRVYADFRNEETYFTTAFDLILSIYEFPPNHTAVADLRELLRKRESARV
jgi:small GTP-binding protein